MNVGTINTKTNNEASSLQSNSTLRIRGSKSVSKRQVGRTQLGANNNSNVIPSVSSAVSKKRTSTVKGGPQNTTGVSKDWSTRKDAGDQEKLSQELNSKTQELDLLHRQYEGLQERMSKLISEKNSYVTEIGTVRTSRLQDIAKIKKLLDAAQTKIQENRTKLGRVEQIEHAIMKLYLEMKERGSEAISREDSQLNMVKREAEDYRKENPLLLLDGLKKNMRTLLAFKDDFENELKDQIRRRKSTAEVKLDQLKKRMIQLEKDTLLYKSNADKAIQIKDEALSSKEIISNQSSKTIFALEQDKREMLEMKTNKEKEIQKLKSMLDRRDEILRHREIQMMKITQLQSQIEKNKTFHRLELESLVADNAAVLHEKEKQLAFYNKVKAEKKELQLQLKNLVTTLNSYKHDANRSKFLELHEREVKLEKKIQEMERNLAEARQKLQNAQDETAYLLNEHQNLKKEAEDEAEKMRKSRHAMSRESEKRLKETITKHYHENMERNPQLAAYYKKKLKEKEKEHTDLTKQVRKMILADHTDSMMQRNYEMEIFNLVGDIESIKRQTVTGTTEMDNKPEAALRKRNRELEMRLEDYSTIETQAKTQAMAYERLEARSVSRDTTRLSAGTPTLDGSSDKQHQ